MYVDVRVHGVCVKGCTCEGGVCVCEGMCMYVCVCVKGCTCMCVCEGGACVCVCV